MAQRGATVMQWAAAPATPTGRLPFSLRSLNGSRQERERAPGTHGSFAPTLQPASL